MLVGGYSCSMGPSMRYGGLTRDNPLPSSHSFSTVVRFGAKGKGPKSLEGRRLLVGASDGRKDGGAAERIRNLKKKAQTATPGCGNGGRGCDEGCNRATMPLNQLSKGLSDYKGSFLHLEL